MQKQQKASRIVSTVALLKAHPNTKKKAFLIVEGVTDWRVFRRFIDPSKCELIIADGREEVQKALVQSNSQNWTGILGIVDADLDYALTKFSLTKNIFFTDTRDLENLIFHSPALETIVSEFLPKDKIKNLDQVTKSLRQTVNEIVFLMGLFHLYAKINNLSIVYDIPVNLVFSYVDQTTLSADLSKLITVILSLNTISHTSIQIETTIQQLQKTMSFEHICRGHDLVFIMSLTFSAFYQSFFGKVLPKKHSKRISQEYFDSSLRQSYELRFFKFTNLYKEIEKWEITHNFSVFLI